MIKFSIVIPVYNVEKYLDQCVQSVVDQSFRDFEIILVDDGSPDRSGELCDTWAAKDSRIRVIHQKNGGLSAARNTGIRHAAGQYIMFLDSDDWWVDSQVLKQMNEKLDNNCVDVLSFNYRKSYNGNMEPAYFPAEIPDSATAENLEWMLRWDCWVTGACNKIIRRDLLIAHNLYFRTGVVSEDIDWTLRLALCAEHFAFANVCVFIYRQHSSSISNSMSREKVECLCNNVRECVSLLEKAPSEKAELLKSFVAYQYGTLLHNVANLPVCDRSNALMAGVKNMKWLLNHSPNAKVRLLRICSRIGGLPCVLLLLNVRQKLLVLSGKGV